MCFLKNKLYDFFHILKGVRQKYPLSRILFNILINDIYKKCGKIGVLLDNLLKIVNGLNYIYNEI